MKPVENFVVWFYRSVWVEDIIQCLDTGNTPLPLLYLYIYIQHTGMANYL